MELGFILTVSYSETHVETAFSVFTQRGMSIPFLAKHFELALPGDQSVIILTSGDSDGNVFSETDA